MTKVPLSMSLDQWQVFDRFGGFDKVVQKLQSLPEYPQCASGAGVICFLREGVRVYRKNPVLLSMRSDTVGPGYGITGGGFVKIGRIEGTPKGTVVETAVEAHEEGFEENHGFQDVIGEKQFLERAQPVATFHVHRDDDYNNRVHSCVFYALGLYQNEWDAMRKLPPGEDGERVGDLIEATLLWDADISRVEPEKSIKLVTSDGVELSKKDFWHSHELRAFGMIAWLAEQGKLWGD